ncbi:MAG: pantetheine-phosphate adenylyltransferase [Bacteroidota bacterium]
MTKALFPGSFDPFTKGHDSIVKRGLKFFDEIVIGIGINSTKKYYFTTEERIEMISELYKDFSGVSVIGFQGLTVDFCREINAHFLLRGLRNGADFEYEKNIAFTNEMLALDIQTVFLLTEQKYAAISSTILREILNNKGDISEFVPEGMKFPK